MDKIIIEGQKALSGNVRISGAKNAVLPLMAATLMVNGKSRITRVPDLRDVRTMIRLMEIIGADCKYSNGTLVVDGSKVDNPVAPYELVKTMRASFYVLGPLLARFGEVKVSLPGGCAWGPRPVDFHLMALKKLGAKIELEKGYIVARSNNLTGSKIKFKYPSVGATGNTLMAASMASGTTIIKNSSCEPEIVQLCEYLNSMGASISGIGTKDIIIDGVKGLTARNVEVIPDRIEAGTFLMAGAVLGEITLTDANHFHLNEVIEALRGVGCQFKLSENSIKISPSKNIIPKNVITDVYPGFPTDLQAQWMVMMALSNGTSELTDTVYHDRFNHVPELNRLGADIKIEKNMAIIKGVSNLIGAPVMSTDIRASASLILGGLFAEGLTEVNRVYHIDRGYENIEEKFSKLGANIQRVSS
tara:strand:+ start:9486 stop:10736 length:1251 start_codon:yes stop_codon:yes gene_type:complete